MRDPRIEKLAEVLVDYSTEVRAKQIVRITSDPVAMPLVEAVYERCLRAGAYPYVKLQPDSVTDLFFAHGSDEQLGYVSPLALHEIETIDVSIGFWADTNTRSRSRVEPRRLGLASAARKPIFDVFLRRAAAVDKPEDYPGVKPLRWVGTQYPTLASAQDAEMSLTEYEDFVFGAGHLDAVNPASVWAGIKEKQEKLRAYLTGKKELRFRASNGTDLRVNVEGMTWVNCCGESNFPDGEVFTGPNLEASDGGVNGVVRYSFPAVYQGRAAEGVELVFERGRVVKASAEKGEAFLLAMLDQDEGARNLGEIAIGTNYSITEFSRNTLFDEKIGGTFHAAVGEGYPETGNTNKSGLHWDMVCDLRSPANGGVHETGGTIEVDGEVISRDGKFVFEGWPGG
ncbi:aminopeptidase [Mucisphaera calidilacus]|uniref:Aminopeptidase 2 n=1 Tax=Mucisphaera calidilacus TaxID=2527982 RepID=A0A518BZ70_9BACT|nr:aminopeptidase [Mucisphaera calidilacus]QDU72266.1 Aminopeptidase 2 [Mucisphaera calidilacus]